MFVATSAALLVGMGLVMCRALLGPTAYDRVLALNNMGTKIVVLIAVLGFLNGRPEFLDLSLAYALINFIGTIAVLKYIEYGDLGAGSVPDGAPPPEGFRPDAARSAGAPGGGAGPDAASPGGPHRAPHPDPEAT